MKTCPKCKCSKSLERFAKNKCQPTGHDSWCKDCNNEKNRKRRAENRTAETASNRAYRVRLRKQVYDHYGHVCACPGCEVTQFQFLTVDHIDGTGYLHRQEIGERSICRWLIDNSFPPGFQVLCFNCNAAKRNKPNCPVHPTSGSLNQFITRGAYRLRGV